MIPQIPLPLTDEWVASAIKYATANTKEDKADASEPFIRYGHEAAFSSAQILAKAYVREVHRRQEATAEAQASLVQLEMDFEELAQQVNPVPAVIRFGIFLVITSAFAIIGYALGRAHP